MRRRSIQYIDVGTSGGIFGLERGYCLMIGGEPEPVARLEPIFRGARAGSLERAADPRARRRRRPFGEGYLHCGPVGGHFVKMVHNGVEYGLMAACAEGLNVLRHANIGKSNGRPDDAETGPRRDPEYCLYDIDITEVAEVWRRGSVVASWLLDLTAAALHEAPTLEGFAGQVSDSGERQWTVEAPVAEGVPANVLTTALYERFSSRREGDFGDKLLSAMRKEFGGHLERPAGG